MTNGIEVGKMYPGTTELRHTSNGTSYKAWSYGTPNSVNGIGVKHEYFNATEKTIKYVTFVYVPYNQVGDIVACRTTHKTEVSAKITGPIEPNEKLEAQWDVLWYNGTVEEVRIKEVIIQYMDDTHETIRGEDLKNIESKDSVYYEKYGKQIEAQRAEKARKSKLKKAYLSFMVLTCLKNAKEDEEVKFHTNQGLWLLIAEVLAIIISCIPKVGTLISFVLWVLAIVFSVKGMKDIDKDQQKEIPLLGKIQLLKYLGIK